jgi:hypothetical protein
MPLTTVKEKNGISVVTDGTLKYLSRVDLAKLLKTTPAVLDPRITTAPNSPITVIDTVDYVSETRLPGLLSYLTRLPTPIAVSNEALNLLKKLSRNVFNLESLLDIEASTISAPSAANIGQTVLSAVDDRVAGLIQAGSGITKVYDDLANTLTISATAVAQPTSEFESIFGDLKNQTAREGLIFCRQYWPGAAATGGAGGLFKAVAGTTLAVDNIKIFAGSGCRWVRQDCETLTAEHAGCINRGGTNSGKYQLFQNPQSQFAAMPLLSDKFANLAAAQAWYPGARLNNPAKVERGETAATAFASSLNNAALQHALTNYAIKATEGVYRFNRPIELFTGMTLIGEGAQSNKTIFVFEADNAFVGRRSSELAATNPQDEIYKFSITIKGIRFMGTGVVVANNSDEQPNVLDVSTYDVTKSGLYLGYRSPVLGSPEALDAFQLMAKCVFENLCFDRFLGSGLALLNGFNNKIYAVDNNNNKGFGLHTLDGNSTIQERCYTGRFNSKGGIWAQGGGEIRACNGYDHFDDVRPAIELGTPGSVQVVRAKIVDGNIEGAGKWGIRMHGDGGSLEFDNPDLQWYCTDIANAPIRIYGGVNLITLNFKTLSYCGSSPNKLKPTNLIMSKGNGNTFVVKKPMKFGANDHTFICVNDAGVDADYGYGNVPLTVPEQDGFANSTQYGLLLAKQKASLLERLWVGDGAAAAAYGVVDTTAALPTVARPPGIYINTNAAATKANGLFLKLTSGATGWSAISVP